ncbi:MAG: hypothetical protein M1821_002773 [Bathelium mastoideum]|nr:MAG: hypothetical protein M1821_002773 [Bathelium mastoideum]
MERSYCLSPRSNMFSWNDDHSSGFDPCDSQPHTDGGFADKVACISPGDLQHYPDAQHDHIETELPEFERRPQGEHVWYPHEVEITDADLHSESRDSTAASEDETLLDAEGDDVDEAEQDDCRDDTYEPRKTRSSTMNARRRSAAQPKSKTSPRGHKRTASSSSASNKITKTAISQSSRSRRKTSIKSEPGPDSPGTPTNHHSNGGGGDGNASVARPFPCPLAPYNCASAFGSKNEWKRHISSQHLRLGYWRCDLCADPTDRPNDFNRKDLFTQHLRRMHAAALQEPQPPLADSSTPTKAPPSAPEKSSSLSSARGADGPTGSGSGGASNADAEATIVQRCYRPLREAPLVSSCLFCTKRFEGAGSWEKRVEHVGKHFETERKAGREPAPVGQWGVDEALEAWLEREGMIGRSGEGWEIRDGQK